MEIDVKLGINEVMAIMDSWYAQHKQDPIEMAEAVKNILQEPMNVDELESAADSTFWLEFGHETYQMSFSLPGLPTFQNFSDHPQVWPLWSHPVKTSCWTLQHHSPEPPEMEDQQDPLHLEIRGKRSPTIKKAEVQRQKQLHKWKKKEVRS